MPIEILTTKHTALLAKPSTINISSLSIIVNITRGLTIPSRTDNRSRLTLEPAIPTPLRGKTTYSTIRNNTCLILMTENWKPTNQDHNAFNDRGTT